LLLRQTKLIFAFVQQHQKEFAVKLMCQVLDVSVNGYYVWRGRPKRVRALKDRALTEKIKASHQRSRGPYRTLRIQADLAAEGERVSRQRIERLMKAANLRVRCKRQFRVTTKASSTHPLAENLLNREFGTDRPNRKWVTDITSLPTTEGWLYLATVMDLFSKKIVGWAMSKRLHTPLVTAALNMPWQRRQPEAGLLHHSDWGSQYISEVYRHALDRLQAAQSMNNNGQCWDNAVQESFLSTLKVELDLHQARGTRAQTRSDVFEWIEVFYNQQRRHSSLDYRFPTAFKEQTTHPELRLL